MSENFDPKVTTIAETDSYAVWSAEEPDGETTYNLELNNVTIHMFEEEYAEFLELVKKLK
ncbi:MAG TPA: hypothetical protein PKK09_01985 [Anaerolineaceae bacterium]|jgi:hypothetical protein|nr:hypothetical protein [Anaerolineaceae bacterium]NMC16826.1 hypothetical protein [Chloroflexota bacterium]HNS06706.1 hypothetical protein [Anaerolineaceae bacterium]HNW14288.1 hypothetical protein [Anaerolineaceae bacterium]HOQ68920.1 hypothetical protein [Anaerolineaceae bacterium]